MPTDKPIKKRSARKTSGAGLPSRQLQGYVTWPTEDDERTKVESAILRGETELAIHFNVVPRGKTPESYSVLLRQQSALLFEGDWTYRTAGDLEKGTCSCRLYWNADRLALVGTWMEDGYAFDWLAELEPA